MRFNSALASSLLFVPIVLADSIDQVAGAVLTASDGNEACLFRAGRYIGVTGQFNVPSASGTRGIAIAVRIGGSSTQCSDITGSIDLAAGIDVLTGGNVTSYSGWAQWGDDVRTPLKRFNIATGDIIEASVYMYSPTSGSAILNNTINGQSWGQFFFVDKPAICQRNAGWVVTALANYPPNVMPFSQFSQVNFKSATAQLASLAFVEPGPGKASLPEIMYNITIPLTTSTVAGDTVTIASKVGV